MARSCSLVRPPTAARPNKLVPNGARDLTPRTVPAGNGSGRSGSFVFAPPCRTCANSYSSAIAGWARPSACCSAVVPIRLRDDVLGLPRCRLRRSLSARQPIDAARVRGPAPSSLCSAGSRPPARPSPPVDVRWPSCLSFPLGRRSLLGLRGRWPPAARIPTGAHATNRFHWTGQPAASAHFEGVVDPRTDQWTLGGARALRPFDKYSWPNGDQVYVSQVTGEVAQYTTHSLASGCLPRADSTLAILHPAAQKWPLVDPGLSFGSPELAWW